MPRKQLSGAQKRRLAKARAIAGQVLMPRAPPASALQSLTGVTKEKVRIYRAMMDGRMSAEAYLVAVRGLSALATALGAVEAERQREIDERLAAGIEALERSRQPSVPAIESLPAASIGPIGGELMPRESSDAEVSE
jgi:hypothetical protein